MTNAEIIKAIRENEECNDCAIAIHDDCNERRMSFAAAYALEVADKRIARLEEDLKTREAEREVMQDTIKICEEAADRYKAQIPKWISVEDHLPEESGEYIVYIQMGTGVEVPDFFGSDDLSYVTSMYFKESQKLWLDEYDEAYNADLSLVDTANDYHVTHWMPLPQKPKGEQE